MAEATPLNEADSGDPLQTHETPLSIFERKALFMLENE